jgi:hypothetical protein
METTQVNLRDMPYVRKLAEAISDLDEVSMASAFWRIDQASYFDVMEMWQIYCGRIPEK